MSGRARRVLSAFLGATGLPLEFWRHGRTEMHLALVRWRQRFGPATRARRRRLLAMRDVKLHLGCGDRILPGWVNVDGWHRPGVACAVDLRRPLPLADASCRLIFSEHVLEHFEFVDIAQILRECHRVLQPGGRLRIIVPDAERYAEAYVQRDLAWLEKVDTGWLNSDGTGPPTRAKILNHVFLNHYHRVALDYETLEALLLRAGFVRVSRSSHLGSRDQELRVDLDVAGRISSSLYVEAER